MNLEDLFDDEPDVPVIQNEPKKKRTGTSIVDVIDNDYRRYAMYVLQNRAIPSVIDGFKPVQRKLFYAMQQETAKKVKAAELGGKLSSYGYAHGETSAQAAVVGMGQEWANNIPEFIGHGNFGTRLIQSAAAPRYIYVSQNPVANKIFRDNDVLNKNVDVDDPEPHHYLPVIPWVLVNGVKGIAVGFAVNILPRSPKDLIKACNQYIKTGSIKIDLLPSFPKYGGSISKIEDGKYSSTGIVEKGSRNSYVISELPWGHDRESYFTTLVDMIEEKKISSFEDHCDASGFNFIVKMDPEQRTNAEKDLVKYFKLSKTYTENYTTLDEHGKLKIFNHVNDIVAYFCDYRIQKKGEQIRFEISKIADDVTFLQAKAKFISSVIDSGIDIVSKMKLQSFKEWTLSVVGNQSYVDRLTRIPIYTFTTDEIDALNATIAQKQEQKENLEAKSYKEAFLEDLNSI